MTNLLTKQISEHGQAIQSLMKEHAINYLPDTEYVQSDEDLSAQVEKIENFEPTTEAENKEIVGDYLAFLNEYFPDGEDEETQADLQADLDEAERYVQSELPAPACIGRFKRTTEGSLMERLLAVIPDEEAEVRLAEEMIQADHPFVPGFHLLSHYDFGDGGIGSVSIILKPNYDLQDQYEGWQILFYSEYDGNGDYTLLNEHVSSNDLREDASMEQMIWNLFVPFAKSTSESFSEIYDSWNK